MENLKQPDPMSMDGALDRNWKIFKSNYSIYALATETSKKTKEVEAATFLYCIGQEAREVYETFEFETEDQRIQVDAIIAKFDDHFLPKSNISVERHTFNSRKQEIGESFQNFLADLRRIANNCDFGTIKNDLIRDHIVCGIEDKNTKDRLLRESELTLDRAIVICKAAEETRKLIQTMKDPVEVMEVKEKRNLVPVGKRFQHSSQTGGKSFQVPRQTLQRPVPKYPRSKPPYQGAGAYSKPEGSNRGPCGKCAQKHPYGKCPAFRKICLKCRKLNHFAICCRSNNVHAIENVSDDLTDLKIDTIHKINVVGNHWYQKFYFHELDVTVSFKLDTGADVNVIPINYISTLRTSSLLKVNNRINITNYDGLQIETLGYADLKTKFNNSDITLRFYIVESRATPVLGIETIQELNLLNKNNIQVIKNANESIFSKYPDVFNGIGLIKDHICKFKLKEHYNPSIAACRRVPFKLLTPLKNELDRLVKLNIIEKVTVATEFVNPIVVVLKPDNSIRLCLDPKQLNSSLVRERFALPTFDELAYKINGSKVFSVLDADKGFWQLKLDRESSDLTTFVTSFGRYKFLRLPFGLSIAPEIFHRIFNDIFGNIENVKIYLDDIIIHAESKQKHDEILIKVINQARKYGIVFNKNKCKIGINKIKHVGHIFSEKGIEMDEERIKAIKDIQSPKNVKELVRFLGMITYVSRFIPNLSKLTQNLRQLTNKNCVYNWNKSHQLEFDNLKTILSTKPVLHYYDDKLPIRLSVDSSKTGMGAVILQNGPIAYASKTLNKAQQNYAQIEKECLAIVFGCQRFRQYLYGKEIIVETDHKPLEHIFKKPLDKCPLRLQRLLLTLQNFNIKVKYVPGKMLYIADALSRSGIDDSTFKVIEDDLESQINLIQYNEITPQNFDEIFIETENDIELQALKKQIKVGWPENKKLLPDILKQYWIDRSEISEINKLLYKGNQLIIPKKLRQSMLSKLHYTHLGIEKTKAKAKESVYWPNMINDIMNLIKNCKTCLTFQNSQQKESLISREMAERPFQIVAADFLNFHGKQYLLLVDTYSKFPEIKSMDSTSSKTVIRQFKSIFARHGKPDLLYTDNGPQFVNYEFQLFLKNWEIKHITSSPKYPQSNGFIERHVQTIKRLLKKSLYDNRDIYVSLLEYRSTPLREGLPSPAELLYGRKLKSMIPCKQNLLMPKYKCNKYHNYYVDDQIKQKKYFDKNARDLLPLKVNTNVLVQIEDKWEPGIIVKVNSNRPRSYDIRLDKTNNILSRNRKFIKPLLEQEYADKAKFDKLLDEQLQNKLEFNDNEINNSLPEQLANNNSDANSCKVNLENDKITESIPEDRKVERPKRMVKIPVRYGNVVSH